MLEQTNETINKLCLDSGMRMDIAAARLIACFTAGSAGTQLPQPNPKAGFGHVVQE